MLGPRFWIEAPAPSSRSRPLIFMLVRASAPKSTATEVPVPLMSVPVLIPTDWSAKVGARFTYSNFTPKPTAKLGESAVPKASEGASS